MTAKHFSHYSVMNSRSARAASYLLSRQSVTVKSWDEFCSYNVGDNTYV